MRVRLVPVGEIFRRMPFVVRDLARETGKRVRLELQGQGTEIDKFLIERMMDPVLHLVRNAVSHGIETVEERIAAGKRPEGTIVRGQSRLRPDPAQTPPCRRQPDARRVPLGAERRPGECRYRRGGSRDRCNVSAWPDIVVGLGIAAMNADAAREVWQTARKEGQGVTPARAVTER